MALPTSFRPLLTRIREVVLNGLGTGSRTIPAGTFSVDAGDFRDEDDALARGVLSKPQAVARIENLTRNDGMNENASFVMVDLSFVVDVAYHSNADLMASERAAIEVQVNNDVTRIRKALNNPTTLERTSAGDETGLCSGLLDWEDSGPVIYDYKNALVKNAVTFTATALFDIGVVLGYPECAVAPVISGDVVAGQTLTSTTGVWLSFPSSYAYQWLLDGVEISGATASTYLVTTDTQLGPIALRVTATNAAGSNSALSNSLVGFLLVAPVASVSTDWATLACTTGTWTNNPTSYAYQWKRAGVSISGATASTYSTTGNDGSGHTDYGPEITCQVTATSLTESVSVTSNALAYLPTAESECLAFNDPSTLTAGEVSAWPSATGTPSWVQATSGKFPVASATSLGGTPGVTFDGVNDYLRTAAVVDLSTYNAITEVIAISDNPAPDALVLYHSNVNITSPGGYLIGRRAYNFQILVYGTGASFGGAFVDGVPFSAYSTPHIVTANIDNASALAAGFIRHNGVTAGIGGINGGDTPGPMGSRFQTMGISSDLVSYPWLGTMGCRTLLSSNAVGSLPMKRVEQFSAWRSGIAPL